MSSTHPQPVHGQAMATMDMTMMSRSLPTAIGPSAYVVEPRNEVKVTVLSRPQHPVTAVDPLVIGQTLPTNTTMESFQSSDTTGGPNMHMSSPGMAFQGRAARDDYFDTEDPSVNLHDFIINSMQSQKNRVILINLEEEFVSYVQDVGRVEPLKLPPWDSYHRMLAHRVAAYFGLEHNVDPLDKMCVIVHKGPNTRLPQRRFGDSMSITSTTDDSDTTEPKLILKRNNKDSTNVNKFETLIASSSDLKTFEEREEEYERARARIFSQQSPLESREPSIMFDLETPSTMTRRKSRILPAIMQHRRAASDTTAFLFNRVAMAELLKEGPSSDHSSRSMTPLFSSLNKSSEAISHAIGSHQKLDQSPAKQISPLTPRKVSQQFEKHNVSSAVVPHSPPKFSKPLPDYEAHVHENKPEQTTAFPNNSMHYPSQMQQNAVPVVYQQPGAVIADPNWYSYQQMMVYQVSPHGYVPAPQYGSMAPQLVQPGQLFAVNQAYPSMTPGGLAQPAMITTGKDMSQQTTQVPGATLEQFPSPTHPAGITLVRPIPQQASPIRVAAKPLGPWGSPMPLMQQPMVVQQPSDQAAFTTLVPMPQDIRTARLADQLDSSLHITDPSMTEMMPNQMNSDSLKPFHSKPTDTQSRIGYDSPNNHLGRYAGSTMAVMGGNSSHQVGGNGLYTVSNMGGVNQNFVGGTVVSPTLPRGPMQFVPQQVHPHMYGGGPDSPYVGPSGHPATQGSVIRYPAGFSPQASSPGQPSTPPVGALSLPPGVLQARPQGVFSPSNAGITHSPVQILGHTLGTSLFSPPPSTTSHPALFGQSFSQSGKMIGLASDTPPHPPIGSGALPDSPGLVQTSYSLGGVVTNSSLGGNGGQPLPPRLSMQNRQQKGGANRYQNQRHPNNRPSKPGSQELVSGAVPGSDQVPSHLSSSLRKEPLLPTPPSHQIVKLDTSLTCGVPLNIMELVSFPPDGSPEMHQVIQVLSEMGVQDTKTGVMSKTGEKVMIAVFENAETAVQALQVKHPHFVLSIPRNNHARFILSLL